MASEQTVDPTTAKGKYNVKSRTYPSDLFDNTQKYGNAWTMININVLSTSKTAQTAKEVQLDEWEKKNFSDYQDRQNNTENPKAAAAGGVLGGAIVGGVAGFLAGRSGGAAAGAGASAIALAPLLLGNTRTTKCIDTAIMLPMPNDLSTNYSMNWGDDATRILDLAMRFGDTTVDALTGSLKGNAASMAKDALISKTLAAQDALGGSGVSAATGLASNPKKEQIFNGVNFRSFNLNYTFYPKSKDDAANAFMIIDTLKYHMHPEYQSAGRFTFIYPSEFDITFYIGDGQENRWITRIATCVLRDMTVNYTPNGQWVSKDDEGGFGGYPNMIQVSLAFQELSILTKEAIEKGF